MHFGLVALVPMFISQFRILNYKSYYNSGAIRLSPGCNVVVGQNNVGKTALLECLGLAFTPGPHRSRQTFPKRSARVDETARVHLTFSLRADELSELLPEAPTFLYVPAHGNHQVSNEMARFEAWLETAPCIFTEWARAPGQNIQLINAQLDGYEPKLLPGVNGATLSLLLDRDSGKLRPASDTYGTVAWTDSLPFRLANIGRSRLFVFRAERPYIGDSPSGNNSVLEPNAANLAQVLNFLQSADPFRWREYVRQVRTVLNQIHDITVPPVAGGNVRIHLWSVDIESGRGDLAFSLQDSGTGVGQVLAIIYAGMMAETAQTLVIDEPQTFLHPDAARKLIALLRSNPRNQYVIGTHASAILSAAGPAAVLLVTLKQSTSVVEEFDANDSGLLRKVLSETGVRLSDVFGADSVLWVEGRTEEECFQEILSLRAPELITGAAILAVRNTGDFGKRTAEEFVALYERVAKTHRLMPAAVGFVFDRELRTPAQRADLERLAKNRVHFLPRRMYENYLIDSDAIAAVATTIAGFTDCSPVEPKTVEGWLAAHKWNAAYFPSVIPPGSQNETKWLKEVDGAKLLESMFQDLFEGRVKYEKVTHGLALTTWLCENKSASLGEVEQLLRSILRPAVERARTGPAGASLPCSPETD